MENNILDFRTSVIITAVGFGLLCIGALLFQFGNFMAARAGISLFLVGILFVGGGVLSALVYGITRLGG